MIKTLKKLSDKEDKLRKLINQENIDYKWILILCLWTVVGLYVYNKVLPFRNVLTSIIYYSITCFIISKNWQSSKVFFKNPFTTLEGEYKISNALWVYPFVILLLSVPLALILNGLGLIGNDPQNINTMAYTLGDYIVKMIMTPVGVILEEAENVLLLLVVGSFLKDKVKIGWMPLNVMIVAILFGGLHVTAWGPEAAVNRMFIHLPFLFSVLILRNVWPCILAHLYQNWMTHSSVMVEGFSATFVTYGLLLLILIMAYRELHKKWLIRKT